MSHDPVEQATSVQARLQNARATILATDKVTLEIPGYGGLFAHYRLLDFRDTRKVGEETTASGVKGEIDRELYLAANHLLAASTGTEAHIDGDIHDLQRPLGRALAEYLGLGDEFENDRQALFVIFRREIDLMDQFVELQGQKAFADQEADKTLLGESGAARA